MAQGRVVVGITHRPINASSCKLLRMVVRDELLYQRVPQRAQTHTDRLIELLVPGVLVAVEIRPVVSGASRLFLGAGPRGAPTPPGPLMFWTPRP